MAKCSFSRRDFLKLSAASGSAWALSSCSSLDSFFMGNRRDLRNEVVILGAGAAGLAAAFDLKKKKVPFRIFEASGRVGGRVHSVQLFPQDSMAVELGAEFFEPSHTDVLGLMKELNLPWREVKPAGSLEAHYFSFDGKTYRSRDIAPKMKTLQAPLRRLRTDLFRDQSVTLSYRNSLQFERAAYYDSLSLRDLLNTWKGEVDSLILRLIEVQAVNRFGVDAEEQSSLHFLSTVDAEGSSLLGTVPLLRAEGGLSSLMQTLSARVAGVIPDYLVRMNSPLVKVAEEDGIFELTFKTPQGEETFKTRRVICTIPFSKLRDVKGISDLQFSNAKKENILQQAYATHSKGALGFTQAFWQANRGAVVANVGNFTGNFVTQKLWDSSRAVARDRRGAPLPPAVLSFQRGGKSGQGASTETISQAVKDLELFYRDVPAPTAEEFVNWSQRKWAAGSMAVYKPGQYMKYRGVAGEPEYNGRFLFAGEHTSLRYAGTLQGALETGFHAARQISL